MDRRDAPVFHPAAGLRSAAERVRKQCAGQPRDSKRVYRPVHFRFAFADRDQLRHRAGFRHLAPDATRQHDLLCVQRFANSGPPYVESRIPIHALHHGLSAKPVRARSIRVQRQLYAGSRESFKHGRSLRGLPVRRRFADAARCWHHAGLSAARQFRGFRAGRISRDLAYQSHAGIALRTHHALHRRSRTVC